MLYAMIVCGIGWSECNFVGMVPQRQCQAMMNMAMERMPVICIADTGETFRTPEVWARK